MITLDSVPARMCIEVANERTDYTLEPESAERVRRLAIELRVSPAPVEQFWTRIRNHSTHRMRFEFCDVPVVRAGAGRVERAR